MNNNTRNVRALAEIGNDTRLLIISRTCAAQLTNDNYCRIVVCIIFIFFFFVVFVSRIFSLRTIYHVTAASNNTAKTVGLREGVAGELK